MAPDALLNRKKVDSQVANGPTQKIVDETGQQGNPVPRLQRTPTLDHCPDSYDDLEGLEYPPAMYTAMEKYLPPELLGAPRTRKLEVLDRILAKYRPNGERSRLQKHSEYRDRIRHSYQPLHQELYSLDPEKFFVQTFLDAIKDGTPEAFRRVMTEPSPGIYIFSMLQPTFCSKMLDEVEHFERWAANARIKIMRPNTMNKYGAVLDDIGMESMLDQLMSRFISPMASVLFTEVGGSSLDTHHGFVVEYSMDRDLELGFHVDDSEVTLNVCLGREFNGGELFFRGIRCDKHVNGEVRPEEVLEYSHVPGRAILHAGRHRHGAKAITSGHRINLILWCRSSTSRELKKYQNDFSSWCGECQLRKQDRRRRMVNPKRQVTV
eukprot:c22344_g1_i1 orf=239-1375(+)